MIACLQHGRAELKRVGEVILSDPLVLKAIQDLKMPSDTVIQVDTAGNSRICPQAYGC